MPFGLPAGDTDSDGDCDAADVTLILSWVGSSYDVRGDLDLDGDVDGTDVSDAQSRSLGTTLGRGTLSAIENRNGYAGYVYADSSEAYFVRYRVLSPELGRWLSRDPLEYVDGKSLFQYVSSRPITVVDPLGLCAGNPGTSPIEFRVVGTDDPCKDIEDDFERCMCYADGDKKKECLCRAERDRRKGLNDCTADYAVCMASGGTAALIAAGVSAGSGGVIIGLSTIFWCGYDYRKCNKRVERDYKG